MDLEDMLREGFSADELRKEFEDELKEAMESIEKEKSKWTIDADSVEDARDRLIDDIFEYVAALGLLDDDDIDDEDLHDKVAKSFKEFEQEVEEFVNLFSKMKVTKTTKHLDPDTVIKTFIATL